MNTDLISRRDAIEALGKDPSFKVKLFWRSYDEGRSDQWFRDVSVLTMLPSAQPEIIYCKDCKHYHADIFGSELKLPPMYDHIIVAHHGCKRWSQDENDMKCVKPDGYCFLAERREDETYLCK